MVGVHFRTVHLQLDEVNGAIIAAVDTVAERLAALGRSPNGTPGCVAANAGSFEVPAGFLCDRKAIELAYGGACELVRFIREQVGPLEQIDTVNADVLH